MEQLKEKLGKIKFTLAPIEKAYYTELVVAGALSKNELTDLEELVDKLVEMEVEFMNSENERRSSLIKKFQIMMKKDYQAVWSKAHQMFDEFLSNKLLENL